MKKEKIRVYLYTRVSTTIQVDGYSLDAQKARMKAFAELMTMKSPVNTKMRVNPASPLKAEWSLTA